MILDYSSPGHYLIALLPETVLTLGAFALGGSQVPAGPVEAHAVSLGLDWFLIDLLRETLGGRPGPALDCIEGLDDRET